MSKTATTADVFSSWLTAHRKNVRHHELLLLSERDGLREKVANELRRIIRDHYVSPAITAKRLTELGAPRTAKLLKDHIPKTKTARSGDLGEILATEIAERLMQFRVPIRRLRWKDGRNMALRGDDIVAVAKASNTSLKFLKGESKSRAILNSTVVDEACESLDRDRGRPSRHSVLFVAERLRERGEDGLALQLENAVLQSFRSSIVEHLLFTVSVSYPETHLNDHLTGCNKKRVRHAVGVQIKDHVAFVKSLYSTI